METIKALARRKMGRQATQTFAPERQIGDAATAFCYSENELITRDLRGTLVSSDLRLVRKLPQVAEEQHVEQVAEFLSHGVPTPIYLLLGKLPSNSLKKSSATFSSMMRFLQRHNKVFCWTTDPQQHTIIRLKAPRMTSK